MNKFDFITIKKEKPECIVFMVLDDCNLSSFMLMDNTYGEDNNLSNINRHCFIFPNVNVKGGDYIKIYSGTGERDYFKNRAGTTTYNFYWGYDEDQSIWNDSSDRAFIVEFNMVQSFKV